MSQLVPCPCCQRHVRLTESSCPFCSTALSSSELSVAHASRLGPVQRGLKRAALFAIGAGVAAAAPGCGGRSDDGGGESTETVQPVYGAPVTTSTTSTTTTSSSGTATTATTDTSTTDTGATSTTETIEVPPIGSSQPIYGAPIGLDTTTTNTSSGDMNGTATTTDGQTTTVTGTTDWQTTTTTAPSAQPVYGAPVIIEATTDVDAGAAQATDPVVAEPADGGGFSDGGADATAVSQPIDPDPDAGFQVQPLYGAVAPLK